MGNTNTGTWLCFIHKILSKKILFNPLPNLHIYRGLDFLHRQHFEHVFLRIHFFSVAIRCQHTAVDSETASMNGPRTQGTLKESAGSSHENPGKSETVSTQQGEGKQGIAGMEA